MVFAHGLNPLYEVSLTNVKVKDPYPFVFPSRNDEAIFIPGRIRGMIESITELTEDFVQDIQKDMINPLIKPHLDSSICYIRIKNKDIRQVDCKNSSSCPYSNIGKNLEFLSSIPIPQAARKFTNGVQVAPHREYCWRDDLRKIIAMYEKYKIYNLKINIGAIGTVKEIVKVLSPVDLLNKIPINAIYYYIYPESERKDSEDPEAVEASMEELHEILSKIQTEKAEEACFEDYNKCMFYTPV